MKRKMLVPEYLKSFQCLAGACEDSCCSSFSVPIGKPTYELYEGIQDKDFQGLFQKHISLNESSISTLDYAAIKTGCKCPFQLGDGRCGIQVKFGEPALSTACSKYPRQINAFEMDFERSATLSCPEIARLALKNRNGIRFIESDEDIDERDFVTRRITKDMAPMVAYFYELRDFSIQTLQNRNWGLDDRLKILDSFFKDLNELILSQREYKIPELIQQHKNGASKSENPPLIDEKQLVNSIAALKHHGSFVASYDKIFSCVFEGYNHLYPNLGEEFLQQNPHLLENFLVSYVFKNQFPFSFGNNIYQSFQMLYLVFYTIKTHILGAASQLKMMDETRAIQIMQAWTKEAEHSNMYLPYLFNDFFA